MTRITKKRTHTNETNGATSLEGSASNIDLTAIANLDGLGGLLKGAILRGDRRSVRSIVIEPTEVVALLECQHRVYRGKKRGHDLKCE